MAPARVFVMMKPLAESKSRLAGELPAARRALLSIGMLVRVLRAACAQSDAAVTVVGGDETVRTLSESLGAAFLPEPAAGLNESLAHALGDAGGLYLPADLPLIEREDVARLLAEAGPGHIVLAPDRRDEGTNALLLPPGIGFAPAFGERSFERHLRQARELGLEARVCRGAGLLLDVDTPADLTALLDRRPAWWEETESMLRALSLPDETLSASSRPSPL